MTDQNVINVDLTVLTNKEVLEKIKQDGHVGAANWLQQIAPEPKPSEIAIKFSLTRLSDKNKKLSKMISK